jgi:hypothetical protein
MTSGWCMSMGARQHGACRIETCECPCHTGDTGAECAIMERSRQVRKHQTAPNPASLVLPEERS